MRHAISIACTQGAPIHTANVPESSLFSRFFCRWSIVVVGCRPCGVFDVNKRMKFQWNRLWRYARPITIMTTTDSPTAATLHCICRLMCGLSVRHGLVKLVRILHNLIFKSFSPASTWRRWLAINRYDRLSIYATVPTAGRKIKL